MEGRRIDTTRKKNKQVKPVTGKRSQTDDHT